jgi:hypothetical protein
MRFVVLLLLLASPAAAQTPPPAPAPTQTPAPAQPPAPTPVAAPQAAPEPPDPLARLPWFAVDAHAATVGLPQAEGWVPVVPAETPLPGRNWGFGGGVTVYPFKLGFVTFGVGASLLKGSGVSEPLMTVPASPATPNTPPATPTTTVVRTGVTHMLPHVSINFGRKLGWSYLSAGMGRSKVTSSADAFGTIPEIVVPEAWSQSLFFGGGAKWFMKPHLGAGFDVKFITLSSRSPTDTVPSARRTKLWNISAGISIQ